MKNHTYSVEQLVHFNCGKCQKWWSISDYQISPLTQTCPHCGHCAHICKAEEAPKPEPVITKEELHNLINMVFAGYTINVVQKDVGDANTK